jgi:predicted RNA binding protein YcfA (HicA-like mRNA interferase family)
VKRKLQAAGFVAATQRGSHVKFVRHGPEGIRTVIVPDHREVAVGTLRSILRQAGLTDDAFNAL